MWNASRFCVSSLRRGHANLLCIVPILVYVLPKQERSSSEFLPYLYCILAEKALGNFKDVQGVRGGLILGVAFEYLPHAYIFQIVDWVHHKKNNK